MRSSFKSHRVLANRTLILGSVFIYFACSGLDCPGGNGNGPAASKASIASAYITNASDNTVTSFSVDSKTGAPAKTGTFAAGHTPVAVAALSIPNQLGYVYVVNKNDNTISQYSIGDSGGLTPLAPPTVATGAQPVSICEIDTSKTDGRRSIFVANQIGNTISYYNVNSDGTLALLSTFSSGGTGPVRVSGYMGFIYVLNSGDNSICKFAYTGGSATTSLASKLSLPSNGLAVDMAEIADTGTSGGSITQYLYVVDSAHNTLSKYQGDPVVSSLQSMVVTNIPVSIAVEYGNGFDKAKSVDTSGIYVGSPLGYIYQYIEDTTPGTSTMSAQAVPSLTFPPQQVILRDISNSQAVVVGGSEGNSPVPPHCLYVLLTDSNTVGVYSTLSFVTVGPNTYDTSAINTATMTETPTGKYPSDIAFAVSQFTEGSVQTTVKSIRKTR